MISGHSFRLFVEQELGKFPHFVIYAILEWTLIALLFLDGFLALVSSEFAEFFDLRAPCVLCTRIDHVLTRKRLRCSYNDSICEGHKKDLSSLAYCHVHRKLSDIRRMCEGCLLSFATDNKTSDSDAYKSLNGAMNKEIEGLFDDKVHSSGKDDMVQSGNVNNDNGNVMFCSCCGEPMKVKSSKKGYQKGSGNINNPAFPSHIVSRLAQAPAPSPRASFGSWRAEDARNTLELTHIRCQELKMSSNSPPEEEDTRNVVDPGKEDAKTAPGPSLTEPDDLMDDAGRTPSYVKGNRFFGIPITDSAAASPRWANRMPRKSLLDKVELASDPVEAIAGNETDTEAILNRLKRQVRLDRKSLIALYMELDEERSASAVAANNAMAMITRLQAEKAAVQMEALQYQRMMEEQAEYDQEALQMMKDFLAKREDEIKDLEAELDLYRDRYGLAREITRGDPLERSQSFSSFTERSDHGSPLFSIVATDTEMEVPDHASDKSNKSSREEVENIVRKIEGNHDGECNNDNQDEEDEDSGGLSVDIERERAFLLGQLRMLESRILHKSTDNLASKEEETDENDNMIAREVTELGEKLRALEEDSRFLKHALLMLQKDRREGSKLLMEIAQNLQKLRQKDTLPVEPVIAVAS